jgi:hypothetical protein
MRIQIGIHKVLESVSNADPDPQPWFNRYLHDEFGHWTVASRDALRPVFIKMRFPVSRLDWTARI